MAGSAALQSSTEHDQLNCSTRSIPDEHGCKVQYHTEPHQGGQERPQLVDFPKQTIDNGILNFPLPSSPTCVGGIGFDYHIRNTQVADGQQGRP